MEGANALNRNGKRNDSILCYLVIQTAFVFPKLILLCISRWPQVKMKLMLQGAGADSSSPCRLLVWLDWDSLILQFLDRPVACGSLKILLLGSPDFYSLYNYRN